MSVSVESIGLTGQDQRFLVPESLMDAVQQAEMLDVSLYGEGASFLLPEFEHRRRFTGEIVAKNQAKYAAIVKAIGEGLGVRQIA